MIPNLARFHPQIVHFVVGLLFVGVPLRIISLLRRPKFVNPAATLLLLLGAGAAVVAVRSGHDAHDRVERIPGVRQAVSAHEDAADDTRAIFLGVAAIELVALGLLATSKTRKYARGAQALSALVGVVGLFVLYQAADRGGNLVYSYAGGPGLRTGDPQDVQRLLVAGLYEQAQLDRREGRSADAARLIDELVQQKPHDPAVALLRAESLLRDRHDPRGTLAALAVMPTNDPGARFRLGLLQADAYQALQIPDSARMILEGLVHENPRFGRRLQPRIDSLSHLTTSGQ